MHEAEIDIPNLPRAAETVHVVPGLTSHSLFSARQLCDAGCVVEFAATNVTVRHNDSIVLQGHRTPAIQLLHIDLPKEAPIAESNAAVGSTIHFELTVSFAHASHWSPALSTLAAALDKNHVPIFLAFPLRPFEIIRHTLPLQSKVTWTNLKKSTVHQNSITLIKPDAAPDDPKACPHAPVDGARSHSCFVGTIKITGQIHANQTGKISTPSSTSNNCLLVLHDHDSNPVLAVAMKS
jgi:hypothetical protein